VTPGSLDPNAGSIGQSWDSKCIIQTRAEYKAAEVMPIGALVQYWSGIEFASVSYMKKNDRPSCMHSDVRPSGTRFVRIRTAMARGG